MSAASHPPVVDLSDDASFAEGFPHESFAWLRDNAPLFWHAPTAVTPDGEGFWVASRYADVSAMQRDAVTFSSDRVGERTGGGTALKDESSAGIALNATDDPRHRRLRSLVNKGFTPRAVGALEGELTARMHKLVEAVEDYDHFDFVHAIARELPSQAICSVLGIPQEDRPQLIDWMDQGLAADSPSILGGDAMAKIVGYAQQIIEEKRRRPARDILSTIVHAELEDGSKLGERELVAFFCLLFPAGAETTRGALAGAVMAFIDFPDQYERLRAEPSLLRSAVEEIVRFTTPSVYKRRTATRDVELHGETIRAGDKVTFWEMSANRDERFFERPFAFDVARSPNAHLAFGAGVHFCLGANLARLELTVALRELTARFSAFERVGALEWMPNNRLLGLRKLEVAARREPQ